MQPEISIRCSSCGAAVRERAMFCPECGNTLARAEAESSAPEISPDVSTGLESQTAPAQTEGAGKSMNPETPASKRGKDESDAPHGARERTKERLHRASTAARGAIEGNVKRVEKIHHVSTAMFEEAHYDPSLRFVLVSLGLFIIFVVLLILSKVMG